MILTLTLGSLHETRWSGWSLARIVDLTGSFQENQAWSTDWVVWSWCAQCRAREGGAQ